VEQKCKYYFFKEFSVKSQPLGALYMVEKITGEHMVRLVSKPGCRQD